MKKMMIPALAALVACVGCTSYHIEKGSQELQTPALTDSAEYSTQWAVADKQVTADATAGVNFWIFPTGESKYADVEGMLPTISPTGSAVNLAKQAATYKALQQNGADALLGCVYSYTISDYFFFSTVECQVKGFPAKVTGLTMKTDKVIFVPKDMQGMHVKPEQSVEMLSKDSGSKKTLGGWF